MSKVLDFDPETLQARKMATFASNFPCLQGAPGVEPWDSLQLDEWAMKGVSHGERCTAQFVLAVWGHTTIKGCSWKCGPFDFIEAISVWDEANRNAFLEWAKDPWWP